MTTIQACLNMLKNLPDSKAEIRRVKILIACHEWTESKQIITKAGLTRITHNGALGLLKQGLLERKLATKTYGRTKHQIHVYRTTPKGIAIITELMK
jgi:hypothetical protein